MLITYFIIGCQLEVPKRVLNEEQMALNISYLDIELLKMLMLLTLRLPSDRLRLFKRSRR